MVGYFFSKSWLLPDPLCQAILHHHDENLVSLNDPTARALTAILMCSEFIIQDYDTSGNMKTITAAQWIDIHRDVADELDVDADQMKDFEEDFIEIFNESS